MSEWCTDGLGNTFRMQRVLEDEVALERFEALVHAQQPASVPWTPVTDYSFEARKAIEGQHPALVKEVFQPRYVLDVGAGPGHLAGMLRDGTIRVTEADLHPQPWQTGLDIAQAPCPGYDGETCIGTMPLCTDFDLVICREVLEHLTIRQIRQAVANLCEFSSRFVYVTTRFAKHPSHLLDVDTSDDLDPTHITMMTKPLLRLLFVLEGFTRRADLEARLDWQQKQRVLVYERV
jgi:SAM-dependent methyltransferase